mmetsp:Transcript_21232/g.52594  ORF Transcript_21232/g.52594 Transcript_21232/m.52594 type:complete len:231 (-) Transcript_21232:3057-3749(-)
MHQSLHNEIGCSIGDETIAFHFSQTQSTITRTSFCRLSGQYRTRTSSTSVSLIENHVLQLLIENRSGENIRVQRFTAGTTVKSVFARIIQTISKESLGCCLCSVRGTVLFTKCRGIALATLVQSRLSDEKLQKFPNCHSRRKTVWIHDQVWRVSKIIEGQIFLWYNEPTNTFLTVSGGKLVSDFGSSNLSQHHLDQKLLVFIRCDKDLVHMAWSLSTIRHSGWFVLHCCC